MLRNYSRGEHNDLLITTKECSDHRELLQGEADAVYESNSGTGRASSDASAQAFTGLITVGATVRYRFY